MPFSLLLREGDKRSPEEIEENLEAKAKGRKLNNEYKLLITWACNVLLPNVYNAEVEIYFNLAYYFVESKKVRLVALDFAYGRGLQAV